MGSRARFEPDLKKVEALAAQGLTQAQICSVLGISEQTLYAHKKKNSEFADALKRGQHRGIAAVTNSLFENARDGNLGAQVFYLKNRDRANWRDKWVEDEPDNKTPVVNINMTGYQPDKTDEDSET